MHLRTVAPASQPHVQSKPALVAFSPPATFPALWLSTTFQVCRVTNEADASHASAPAPSNHNDDTLDKPALLTPNLVSPQDGE